MTKLHQVVAVRKGTIEAANKATAPLFHGLKRGDLFAGITQTFRPLEEGGTVLPDDNTEVQVTVSEVLDAFTKSVSKMLDVAATVETANTEAFADVVIDGTTALEHVPVSMLMQLEKFFEREVRGLIRDLPVLDPAESWSVSSTQRLGVYETGEFQTFRTKKVQKPVVLYPATEKHPAQTAMVTEDVIDGYWHKRKFSGAIPAAQKEALLERVEKIIDAIKYAREAANDREVVNQHIAGPLFDYLLG